MSRTLSKAGRPAQILLVEDNDNDAELMRIAFAREGDAFALSHVRNGEECIAFLRREPPYADAPLPDLVLLDLNMPRMDGREVLEELRRVPPPCCPPVIVLSTSDADSDVHMAYRLHCASYIVKPLDFAAFGELVQTVIRYWCGLVVLPTTVRTPPRD